jgi:hypothetical protein
VVCLVSPRWSTSRGRWQIKDETLLIWNRGTGTGLAQIRGDRLVAALPFARTDAILNQWIGIAVGNVISFSTPTARGGGCIFAWAGSGSLQQLELGNRTGLFAKTAPGEWWVLLCQALASWASFFAAKRAHEVGAAAYAQELGIALPGN